MQQTLTNLSNWSKTNNFTINASKTKLLAFNRGAFNWQINYTIDNNQIERVPQMTYLGVIFDKKISFHVQTNEVDAKSIRIANATTRLCRYIGNKKLNVPLYQIYNDPIATYATFVWDRRRRFQSQSLTDGHRRATRTAIGTSWRPNQPNYVSYENRCRRLDILTLNQRKNVLAASFAAKLLRNEIISPSASTLRDALYQPRPNQEQSDCCSTQRCQTSKPKSGRIA